MGLVPSKSRFRREKRRREKNQLFMLLLFVIIAVNRAVFSKIQNLEENLEIEKSKKVFECDFEENWCGLDNLPGGDFLIDENQGRTLTALTGPVFA